MSNAQFRVKAIKLFMEGQKLGTLQKSKTDIDSGDEMIVIEDGIAFSDGKTTVKTTFDCIVPYGDTKQDIIAIILAKKSVTIMYPGLHGKTYASTGRLSGASYDSDNVKGTLNGNYSFAGGEPQVVG